MQQPTIYFNLINNTNINGILPQKSEPYSTGWDVFNSGPDIILSPFEKHLIPLGFRAVIPQGWWFFLVPRSSSVHKKHLHCLYGVIDQSYNLGWYFSAQFIPAYVQKTSAEKQKQKNFLINLKEKNETLSIKHGEKIAQIILMPRYDFVSHEVSDDEFIKLIEEKGDARNGGFGSTGDK